MPRYSEFERNKIQIIRERLGDRLTQVPQFPEVTGDRKILRFLRGHDYDVEKVTILMTKFLDWRRDNKVDDIRQSIVLGGRNKPTDFPRAEVILQLVPQIVLCAYARDKSNAPISVEKFNFLPSVVFQTLTLSEYTEFLIYALEFKSIITDQISEEMDQKYLDSLSPSDRVKAESDDPDIPPYGTLMGLCVIRDLDGLGFDHMSARGQEIVSAIIKMSSDNYPELMRKCHMINAPWIFNTLWYFVKGLLSAKTVAKISLTGSSFMAEMEKDIEPQFVPSNIGGAYNVDGANQESFTFDTVYLCPGMSDSDKESMRQQLLAKEVLEEVARREAAERKAAESSKASSPKTPASNKS